MNERNYKTIAIILTVMLLFNTWQLMQVKQELAALSQNYNNKLISIETDVRNVQNAFDHQYNRISNLLTEQASLFSKTDVSMKLQGNQIAVTMKAVPKELQHNETLMARITADGSVFEQQTDANGTATLLIDPVESIQPSFVIQSPSGMKQEALEDMYVMNYISGSVHASWNHERETVDNELILDLYLEDMPGQPFTADQIAEAHCIIVNTGEQAEGEAAADYPAVEAAKMVKPEHAIEIGQIPEGDTIPVTKQADSNADTIHYQADFTAYYQRKDSIQYNIYFALTTADGITFVTMYNPVADFCQHKGGGSMGSGGESLRPILK